MTDGITAPGLPAAVRSLIEARTGDAVFVVGPDYTISYWDHEATFLTGIRGEDVLGKRCYEVVFGEREDGGPFCTYGCSVMRLAQAGRPVSSYDMRVSAPSGGKRWVNVSVLCIGSEEGPYIVHLMRDSQKTHETIELARGLIKLSRKSEVRKEQDYPGGRTELPALTPRQIEVLNMLATGKSAKEIGRELYLSEATVRNHIRSLLQALGAHSQLEALAKAREVGLISA